jgi:aspartate 1-decarboxylase
MLRDMMIGKLHRGAVTGCELEYPGSLTVDIELIERAGMLVHQRIQLLNSNNGYRLETYLIPGERGKRQIIVNGAAARHAQPGDRVIIVAYGLLDETEIRTLTPKVVALDERNQVIATY